MHQAEFSFAQTFWPTFPANATWPAAAGLRAAGLGGQGRRKDHRARKDSKTQGRARVLERRDRSETRGPQSGPPSLEALIRPGLESGISGSGGRRLIHWANGPMMVMHQEELFSRRHSGSRFPAKASWPAAAGVPAAGLGGRGRRKDHRARTDSKTQGRARVVAQHDGSEAEVLRAVHLHKGH